MICLPLEQREKPVEELEKCCEKVGHLTCHSRAIQEKTEEGAETKLLSPSFFSLTKRQIYSFNK